MVYSLRPEFQTAIPTPEKRDVAAMFMHYMRKTPAGVFACANYEILAESNFPFTREKVDHWIERYRQEHGTNPTLSSGRISKLSDITWGDVNIALLLGLGELEGGSSLDHVLHENGHLNGRPKLTESLMLYHTLKYYLQHNRTFPNQNSGPVDGLEGEDWGNWRTALYNKKRGLKNSMTRDDFFVKYGLRFKIVSDEMVADLARHNLQHFNKLPPRDQKLIIGADGEPIDEIFESWNILYKDALAGRRFAQARYLSEIYVDQGLKIGTISKPVIFNEIAEHLKRHREQPEFPTELSGQVNDYDAEKWINIETYCRQGAGDLDKKTTLAQMVTAFILDQAHKHRACHGTPPDRESGALPDYPDIEWALVDDALINRGKSRSPQHSKTLQQVLEANEHIEGALPAFTDQPAP